MSEIQKPLKSIDVRQICLENDLEISDSQWQLLEKWAVMLLNVNKKLVLYDLYVKKEFRKNMKDILSFEVL